MICAISGELKQVEEDRVHLAVGAVVYELLIPSSDQALLQGQIGQEIIFHTLLYLEGDTSGGNMQPRLLGFSQLQDKRFFEKFITVKGIGPKKALRALAVPAGEIAAAIENKDVRFLMQLPAIGKRMAEQVIAELSGKVQQFVLVASARKAAPAGRGHLRTEEEDALQALMQLGERRDAAEVLLQRAKAGHETPQSAEVLIRDMLRLRAVRA